MKTFLHSLIHTLFIVDNYYLHRIIDRVLTIVRPLTSCLRFFQKLRSREAPAPPPARLAAVCAPPLTTTILLFIICVTFFVQKFQINYLNTTNIYIRFTKLIDLSICRYRHFLIVVKNIF